MSLLQYSGCDVAQGYYFNGPLSAQEFATSLGRLRHFASELARKQFPLNDRYGEVIVLLADYWSPCCANCDTIRCRRLDSKCTYGIAPT